MFMSETFTERQHRDDVNRQLEAQIEEDERVHSEQTSWMLHQGQAGMARLRSQLVQEGEQSGAISCWDERSGKHSID